MLNPCSPLQHTHTHTNILVSKTTKCRIKSLLAHIAFISFNQSFQPMMPCFYRLSYILSSVAHMWRNCYSVTLFFISIYPHIKQIETFANLNVIKTYVFTPANVRYKCLCIEQCSNKTRLVLHTYKNWYSPWATHPCLHWSHVRRWIFPGWKHSHVQFTRVQRMAWKCTGK